MAARRLGPKENMLRVLSRNDPEYVPYRQRPRYIPGMTLVSSPDALAPREGRDIWGVGWQNHGHEWEAYPSFPACHSIEELVEHPFPDPRAMVAGLPEAIGKVNRDESLVVVYQPRGLFERSHLLLGMERLLTAWIDYPEELTVFYDRLADYYIEIAKLHLSMGIDAFRLADDYGTQKSLLVSPEQWRQYIKPGLARWIKVYKDAGKFFFMHSCGYISWLMDDLVEIGIDMIDSLNPSAGNELDQWKRKYGDRISFMGGVDTHRVLSRGTPEEVREEVKLRLRQLGDGGGFMLGPDQNIPFPDRNYQAYLEAAEEYCTYPLRV
ncbi:hypothetical protein HS125_09170 [bacterium]|nr:hypothetical protein [bacterium]